MHLARSLWEKAGLLPTQFPLEFTTLLRAAVC